ITTTMSKPKLEYRVSALHTAVFFFICVFFTIIALLWELRQRYRFHTHIKPHKLSDEILTSIIHDFELFINCSDPFIEHFLDKHPEFKNISPLWVQNSHKYWYTLYIKELKKRGLV
ncbi:MAG: hypothetical protein N3F66_08585, partial [Spirochaetes bacterium]|nr:hypothetical protein [Spirochaetota bacterium]